MKMEKIMWTDPLVEELHRQRREHAARFGFDVAKVFAHYREQQRRASRVGGEVISLAVPNARPAKPAPRRTKRVAG